MRLQDCASIKYLYNHSHAFLTESNTRIFSSDQRPTWGKHRRQWVCIRVHQVLILKLS